jgi:hypothetical protein
VAPPLMEWLFLFFTLNLKGIVLDSSCIFSNYAQETARHVL